MEIASSTNQESPLAHAQKEAQRKSGLDLSLTTSWNTLRVVHIVRILLKGRNPMYVDNKVLTRGDKAGFVVTLVMTLLDLFISGNEIVRRTTVGESLVSIEAEKEIKPIPAAIVGAAVVLSIAEAKKGSTLIKKRKFSTYGRIYETLSAGVIITRLVTQLADTVS